MSDDCIFCKIIKGEIPSSKLYENDDVLVFADLNPVAPVHALIVPKEHYDNILTMSSSEEGLQSLSKLLAALPEISEALGLDKNGFRLINNCGESSGQTVMHMHLHLIGGTDLGPDIR